MAKSISRRAAGRIAATVTVTVLVALPGAGACALPSQAAARSTSATVRPLVSTFLLFKPVRGSRGVKVTLTTADCRRGSQLDATFVDAVGDSTLSHDYVATMTGCQVNQTLTAGTVNARWNASLQLDMKLAARSKPKVQRSKAYPGCYDTTSTTSMVGRGDLRTAIHVPQFGSVRVVRVVAQVIRSVIPVCELDPTHAPSSSSGSGSLTFYGTTGTGGPTLKELENGRQLSASWSDNRAIGATNVQGIASSFTYSAPADDTPAGVERSTFGFSVSGDGAFLPAPNLATATLNLNGPLSSGSLTFTTHGGCPVGIRARNGTLSGTVTINDPVLGTLTLTGAEMGSANLSVIDAESFKCQGQILIRAAITSAPTTRDAALPAFDLTGYPFESGSPTVAAFSRHGW